jgi:hypothetical protein
MAGGLAEWDRAIRAFESRLASELPGASSRAAFQMREALARMYVERGRLADAVRELEIVRRKVPNANARLSAEIVRFIQKLRELELFKVPGVAETIDWAGALTELDQVALDPATVSDTLGVLLKYQDDIARIHGSEAARILDEVKAELAAA